MNHSSSSQPGPASNTSLDQSRSRLFSCATAGLFKNAVETTYGGHGNSFRDLADAHELLGYNSRDPGLLLAINAHLWGALFAIKKFGNAEQKEKWLPLLLEGKVIGGHAITEPHAGSDVQSIKCHYRSVGEGFFLSGHKRYITNTPLAGIMVVYAKNEENQQISAFLLKPDDPGISFESAPTVTACATATMGDIELNKCSIPAARLLGKPGAGSSMIQLALELERAFIFAGIAGVMRWQLAHVIEYVRNRASGSSSLGRHQAVSHKISEMKLRLDTTQLWIWRCAELLDTGKRITVPSAETKLYASEAFLQSSLDASHLLGAAGLNDELTTLINDAVGGRLMSGSSEMQRNIIAAMLGLAMDDNG